MKRIISVSLALLMLLSCFMLLFSCKKEKDGKSNSTSKGQVKDDGSIFYERSLVDDGLDEKDYGGRVLRVATMNAGATDFFVPEEKRNKGDLMLDAMFKRNQDVENRFNVKFEIVYSTNAWQELDDYVQKTVLSGNDEFDVLNGMVMSMGGLVTKNLFLNWYDIEHIDFSRPWWYESNTSELTYNGKTAIAVSHLNFTAVSASYCLFFNKNLATSYELGDIYDLVLSGKWTFDKFSEMVKSIYIDNGNDKRDTEDFYGIAQGPTTVINSYLWAFDCPIVTKDDEGIPTVMKNDDKIESIVDAMYDFCFDNDGVFCDPDSPDSYDADAFFQRRAIFFHSFLGNVTSEKMRNFEDDYGVIPLPKWDENQSEYRTMCGGHHNALAIPKTCRDTEFVGRIIEAMAAESWKTVTPSLYEIALKTRYLRDSESKKIMDLIIEGTTFDFGSVYDNWKGFAFSLQELVKKRSNNFTSYYTSKSYSAKAQIKAILKAFDKMD